ncbi:MAG: amino acid adenylation domain-containing protein [Pseudomonadales bacterium]
MNAPAVQSRTVAGGFLASAQRYPDRPALAIRDDSLSYAELRERAAAIAATLQRHDTADGPALTGIYGHRSFVAFSGVLGALLRGHGYVPLNPVFPSDRNAAMATRAELRCIVAEAQSLARFEEVLEDIPGPLIVLVPDADDISALADAFPRHRFLARPDLVSASSWHPGEADPDGIAYLLFTSGSTGQPKGVMVAHRNVTSFVDCMADRYGVTEHDRFSQTFDLTFDLSAFDMFVAWERGACVCCPTAQEKLFPSKYIDAHQITIWFSVPSTAVMMSKMRMLKPGKYPSIRYSLFCGEALPVEVAHAFQQAAPESRLENLYGPTELTIACTLYEFDATRTPQQALHGVVPIGEPYPDMRALIVDEALRPVADGEAGELIMTGPQLTLGYWKDEEKTRAAFTVPPDETDVFYRTGDRVLRRAPGEPLLYLGRVDNQIKVQGYRVELGEIEAVIREEADTEVAVALGFPVGSNGVEGIVGFISKADADLEALRQAVRGRLPAYMQPSEIRHIPEFPLNANGKVDRPALLRGLQADAAS